MKKIAVNTVKEFLKKHKMDQYDTLTLAIEGGNEFEIQIKTSLSTGEKSVFINRVLSGCFDDANNYRPEYVMPMIRATILQMCTNLPVLSLKHEQAEDGGNLMDLDAMNELYCAMDLDKFKNEAFQHLDIEMTDLCYEAIEWRKTHTLSKHSVDAALRKLLDTLTAKVESADMDALMQYAAQLSKATEHLREDDLLKGIVEFGQKNTQNNVVDIAGLRQ